MMRQPFTFLKCTKGATAVEFALVAPLMLMVLLVIISFTQMFWTYTTMQAAADSTGRYAMVNTGVSNSTLQTQYLTYLNGVDSTGIGVVAADVTSGGTNFKTITATKTFNSLAGGLVPIPPITLTAYSRVPIF